MPDKKYKTIWSGVVTSDDWDGEASVFLSDTVVGVKEQLCEYAIDYCDVEWSANEANETEDIVAEATAILRLAEEERYVDCWNLLHEQWAENWSLSISINKIDVLITQSGDWWDIWLPR